MRTHLAAIKLCFARFQRDRSGGTALLFALALPGLLIAGGGAVDYAAISQSRARLQAAADSAALALAREMTVSPMTNQRAQDLAGAYVNANLNSDYPASVRGELTENGLAIRIKATQPLMPPIGMIAKFTDAKVIEASALARVTASSMQTKLCMLALGGKKDGGLFLHNNSYIAAPECVLHSNSPERYAVIIQKGSKVAASLVCARGGVANNSGGVLQAPLMTDCPVMKDPLVDRPEPPSSGPCTQTAMNIGGAGRTNEGRTPDVRIAQQAKSGAQRSMVVAPPAPIAAPGTSLTLNPGIYCNGLTIEGSARVTLNPGVYVIRDGPLVVQGDAELIGKGVTFLFTGRAAYFRFLDNAMIQISAPTAGVAAGMLLWESRNFVVSLKSWQKGGCDDDDDDDRLFGIIPIGNCAAKAKRVPGQVPEKKTNEHHINSDRARELTGTIYLPNGLLLIDSRRPVADQSPFTVLVASKVDLFDGPNLTLNANYSGTPVPVPSGLGAIGATQVRLGLPGQANPGAPVQK